jgi:hypothetical protein
MKVTASLAISSMVFGVDPLDAPTPRLSNVTRGDAVHDSRIPVVQDRGQVGEEDDRHSRAGAEPAVGELHAAGVDGARRRVLPRRLRFLIY